MTTTSPATTQAMTRRVTLRNLFDKQRPELLSVIAGSDPKKKAEMADRLLRMALTECLKNPVLFDCTQESWALALQTCASQNLYPDSGLGLMYLVPRKQDGALRVSAMRGYQGDITLARRSGEIADIYAEVVYEKDHYKVRMGTDRSIEHEPYEGDEDPGQLRAVYAVAKLRSGETNFVALTKRDVMRHRASAQNPDGAYSPWKNHTGEMWKKTAVHVLFKWLPKSTEEAEHVARSFHAETIETTAVDLGRAELPAGPDLLLAGVTAPSIPTGPAGTCDPIEDKPKGCTHAAIQAQLDTCPPVSVVTCQTCGEDVPGRLTQAAADKLAAAAEREPGSDDGDDAPVLTSPTPEKARKR